MAVVNNLTFHQLEIFWFCGGFSGLFFFCACIIHADSNFLISVGLGMISRQFVLENIFRSLAEWKLSTKSVVG